MPTKKPRIAVTLADDAYRIVSELAEFQRSSRSTVIADVINDLAAPILGQMLETVKAAARIKEENLQGVRDASRGYLDRLDENVAQVDETLELLELMIKRGAADPEPPTSNTGVTTELTHSNHSNRGAGKRGAK